MSHRRVSGPSFGNDVEHGGKHPRTLNIDHPLTPKPIMSRRRQW